MRGSQSFGEPRGGRYGIVRVGKYENLSKRSGRGRRRVLCLMSGNLASDSDGCRGEAGRLLLRDSRLDMAFVGWGGGSLE